MEECNATVTQFLASVEACEQFTSEDVQFCSCWNDPVLEKLGNDVRCLQPIILVLVLFSFCRGCKIKKEETIAKTTRQMCKNAFSNCKKASSKGFKVLSACHRSVSEMVQMKTQLFLNVEKMVKVEGSVKTVDKASLSCSDVLSMMSNISKIAHEKPSSVIISELSSSILESNCNGAAKDALPEFTTARLMVNETLNVICMALMSKFIFQKPKNI